MLFLFVSESNQEFFFARPSNLLMDLRRASSANG